MSDATDNRFYREPPSSNPNLDAIEKFDVPINGMRVTLVRLSEHKRLQRRIGGALAELREAAITQSAASWVRTHAMLILEGHVDDDIAVKSDQPWVAVTQGELSDLLTRLRSESPTRVTATIAAAVIERQQRANDLLKAQMDAMEDCIGVEEGKTFEERAEELIVTEVNHENLRNALPPSDGYMDAYYQVAALLGITTAMPASPKEVFETIMLPRLRELISRDGPPPNDDRDQMLEAIRKLRHFAACIAAGTWDNPVRSAREALNMTQAFERVTVETPAPPCIFRSGCVNGQPCKDARHCTEGAEWKRRLGVSEEDRRG